MEKRRGGNVLSVDMNGKQLLPTVQKGMAVLNVREPRSDYSLDTYYGEYNPPEKPTGLSGGFIIVLLFQYFSKHN